ncbi:winged helix-turn-helix domain-containing protein [Streptomyces sp. NPDC005811]|uniref:winged helix-turn-helix domain-containing protein n=1 Tax=Streptomyces sp. NPDC005811 TaxID=3154565 RepID=UPI0033CFC7C9
MPSEPGDRGRRSCPRTRKCLGRAKRPGSTVGIHDKTPAASPDGLLGSGLHAEPAGPGLGRGLTDALRHTVRTGCLASGTRLPSHSSLAADLGIACNTVAEAYVELVPEGWLSVRQGSGTRVADRTVTPPADYGTVPPLTGAQAPPCVTAGPRPGTPPTWSPAPGTPTSPPSPARSG